MAYTHRIKNGIRVELTAEEISELENQDTIFENQKLDRALENLRQIRNSLLKKTDWLANSDLTMSSDMTTYRQELRDITNGLTTVEQVEAVEFPEKPSE
jgi:hypothetical protein